MIVRTSLLISDDPDDHTEFSEAFNDISEETVVVSVSNVNRAIDLLAQRKCIPDLIFLNTNITDFEPDHFFNSLDGNPSLAGVKVITFGDLPAFNSSRVTSTLDADLSFSELKDALRKIIQDTW